ncbi:uncharacterized protein BDR25DRAFT_355324 [Lindgomyces ingoldianus]|uniref:Uncharacterized protein n=1 Tax=Lindgomyces ingoldianus TaxID=673940 RepID=A0ACB6QX19_9PLEO|nr:uncharacterized protein BDR25DRAFT_355324 [Lindgomyces ingoldianus]KAF2470832.1 hypothetical protein BDR25DRAFT_355324 [Lindgomyces ingoldianus]
MHGLCVLGSLLTSELAEIRIAVIATLGRPRLQLLQGQERHKKALLINPRGLYILHHIYLHFCPLGPFDPAPIPPSKGKPRFGHHLPSFYRVIPMTVHPRQAPLQPSQSNIGPRA